jgi:hypothetical protein
MEIFDDELELDETIDVASSPIAASTSPELLAL